MIKLTDKEVKRNVYLSASAFYNVKFAEDSKKMARMINNTLPLFRKVLNLPTGLKFRVAPLKARNRLGSYNNDLKLVNLSSRMTGRQALVVLAHELIHAEQYHTGKLKMKFDKNKGWVHYWLGDRGSKGTTYSAYRQQPWEIEAYDRQEFVANEVIALMKAKNEKIKSYC